MRKNAGAITDLLIYLNRGKGIPTSESGVPTSETVQQGHLAGDGCSWAPPCHNNTQSPLRNTITPAPFATTAMATATTQVRPPCARAAAVSPAVRILTGGSFSPASS
jgi:hypothetical protein